MRIEKRSDQEAMLVVSGVEGRIEGGVFPLEDVRGSQEEEENDGGGGEGGGDCRRRGERE